MYISEKGMRCVGGGETKLRRGYRDRKHAQLNIESSVYDIRTWRSSSSEPGEKKGRNEDEGRVSRE